MREGFILKGIGGFYYVKTADGILECRARGIFRREGLTPLAGDRVTVGGAPPDCVIEAIHPRRNMMARPPIANLDAIFLVISAVDPRPNVQIIDKLTAAACYYGINPVLVLTKTDLAPLDDLAALYRRAGFQVVDLRREVEAGLRAIREAATGLSVFIGNSGVGKSTLLNELSSELTLETGETSKKLGRGRHTTRAVTLHEWAGGWLADTPGFSALDAEKGFVVDKESMANYFPDFARYRDNCYFTGCSHRVEKGCAVLEALRSGRIEPSRHASYCALYEEAAMRKTY